jgi:hypothetical protein
MSDRCEEETIMLPLQEPNLSRRSYDNFVILRENVCSKQLKKTTWEKKKLISFAESEVKN